MDKKVSRQGKLWKLETFFDLELEKYGGEVILTGSLDIKDSRNVIGVSDPF